MLPIFFQIGLENLISYNFIQIVQAVISHPESNPTERTYSAPKFISSSTCSTSQMYFRKWVICVFIYNIYIHIAYKICQSNMRKKDCLYQVYTQIIYFTTMFVIFK